MLNESLFPSVTLSSDSVVLTMADLQHLVIFVFILGYVVRVLAEKYGDNVITWIKGVRSCQPEQ